MLTASSCATLAAVRCRLTPITLFTVGSYELETNLGIDGNRTSGSMPSDFTLVLGGMTVFNPVCGRPARWRTRSSSRRTSPHGTARHHGTTFQRTAPRSNDHLNSTASTAAAAMNSTYEFFFSGAPRASEDELPVCNPTRYCLQCQEAQPN